MEKHMETTDMMSEEPATWNASPSKYTGLGAAIASEIMIGFWFGIGVILAIRIVDSLDYCIEELMRNK